MEKDPVCGMDVDPITADYQTTYQGKTYYFCSAGCKKDFDKNPKKYIESGKHDDKSGMKHKHSDY